MGILKSLPRLPVLLASETEESTARILLALMLGESSATEAAQRQLGVGLPLFRTDFPGWAVLFRGVQVSA